MYKSGYKVGLGGGSDVASHALISTKLVQRVRLFFLFNLLSCPNNSVEAAELQNWGKMNDFVRRANVFSGRVTSGQKGTFGN